MEINKQQSLTETIINVQGDINTKGFAKDLKNTMQNYSYRGIDPLYNLVSPILVKHGLIIIPKTLNYELIEAGKTSTGAIIWKSKVNMLYTFYHVHNGDIISLEFPGEANDYADKATNKATTSSFKYMMIQVFKMPIVGVENDPDNSTVEADNKQESPVKPSKPEPQNAQPKSPTFEEIKKLFEDNKDKLPKTWIAPLEQHIVNQDMPKLLKAYEEIRKKIK